MTLFPNFQTFSFFLVKGPPSDFLMICDRKDEKSQSAPWLANSVQRLGFLGAVEENT